MKIVRYPIAALITAGLFIPCLVRADDRPDRPWRCEESTITKVGNYFEGNPSSGVYAVFRSKLGVEQFPDTSASVVVRYLDPVMAKQKVGDKVQVCLVNFPDPDRSCKPDKDPRGRIYRVYNYRLKAAYSGPNGNHLCGGA